MYKKPKFIKFSFEHKERLWMKVDKIDDKFVYGKVAKLPISPGIKQNERKKIRISKIIDVMY